MEFGGVVWVVDPLEGFSKATVTDIHADSLTVTRLRDDKQMSVRYEDAHVVDEEERQVDDHCSLMTLHDASLLHNSRLRFHNNLIYTYVGNVLISINPYQLIEGMYTNERRDEYKGKSLGRLPPHIYAIAEKARLEMRRSGECQSIIVSGESGSGKTESQKAILSFFCHGKESTVQRRILEINPILESFGNAKTMRNNNSSRFGKFVEVHWKGENVSGGWISHYLLERSRVTMQQKGERNYHIFYQMIAGCSDATYSRLHLAPPQQFNYLRACASLFGDAPASRCTEKSLHDSLINDARQFTAVLAALADTGMSDDAVQEVLHILAGILHLGNVSFVEDSDARGGGCKVSEGSESSLAVAASLLALDVGELRAALVARIMQPTKGGAMGTIIRVALKATEAAGGRDALAKAIYSRLFDKIVAQVNSSLPFDKGSTQRFIGVLDIAGFEFFQHNSFEQLCINYCNEKLHNFFAERVLGEDQRLYEREGIKFVPIEYSHNDDAIELFEGKGSGIFDVLDEESRLPRPSPMNFTTSVHQKHAQKFRLDKPRSTKEYRHMRDEEGFIVRHFAGAVCYETKEFVEKNKDELHASLQVVVEGSRMSLLSSLFEVRSAPGVGSNIHKLRTATIGNKFKSQLSTLLERLAKTGTHFVRCIKPNEEMKSASFDGGLVMSQMRCAGVPDLVKLMHCGYPSRIGFNDLYNLYASNLPDRLRNLDPRLFCKCLFRAVGLSLNDYAFGTSKVFFRSGKFAEFDQIVHGESGNISALIARTSSYLTRTRWKMVQYCALSCIKLEKKIELRRSAALTLQRYTRGALTRRKFAPRIALSRKVSRLLDAVSEVGEDEMGERRALEERIRQLQDDIKGETPIDEAIRAYDECVRRVDGVIASVREGEKLKKERERVERERREEEEKERKVEEERKLRQQMEEKRREEEARFEENRAREAHAAQLRHDKEKEEKEKKRLDSTLNADRREDCSVSEPQSAVSGDVKTWKYADLRDAINTSTDMQLLMACKEEFHRRLRVYHEWKARSSNQSAPHPLPPCKSSGGQTLRSSEERFFKVPLGSTTGQQGLLYVHFKGQWVERQMELRPHQQPALLTAGRDDSRMMHLSLEQSGLSRRKGAEIKGDDFDTVWSHLGGTPPDTWRP